MTNTYKIHRLGLPFSLPATLPRQTKTPSPPSSPARPLSPLGRIGPGAEDRAWGPPGVGKEAAKSRGTASALFRQHVQGEQ